MTIITKYIITSITKDERHVFNTLIELMKFIKEIGHDDVSMVLSIEHHDDTKKKPKERVRRKCHEFIDPYFHG